MSLRVSNVQLVQFRLLRAHVLRRANDLAELREHRLFGQLLINCFGHTKVDDLGHCLIIVLGDQDVGWLEVAMDDPLLMGVLHRLADGDEQFQTLSRRQIVFVTVLGDRNTLGCPKLMPAIRAV